VNEIPRDETQRLTQRPVLHEARDKIQLGGKALLPVDASARNRFPVCSAEGLEVLCRLRQAYAKGPREIGAQNPSSP
jgi:hypothetical protein